jgi:hypothetical protein
MTTDPTTLKANFDKANTDYANLMGPGGWFAQDQAALAAALVTMKNMKSGEGLQYAQMVVFGLVQKVQGDKVEGVADQENMMTAAKNYAAYIQGILNEGTNVSPTDAANFVQATNDFKAELEQLQSNPVLAGAVDPSLLSGMIGFVGDIQTAVSAGSASANAFLVQLGIPASEVPPGDGAFDAQTFRAVWIAWNTEAQSDPANHAVILQPIEGPQQAQSAINSMNSNLNNLTTAVSGQSQTLSFQLNQVVNYYQSVTAAEGSIMKSSNGAIGQMVNNQITH